MVDEPSQDQRSASLRELLAQPVPKPVFPEQNADGVDLSLIRSNLRLTVEERIRRADQARWQAEQLSKYARRV